MPGRDIRILVINPNSSEAMTKGMDEAIKSLGLPTSIKIDTYTAPADSPASINNDDDIRASTLAVLEDLEPRADELENTYDGILIACYSVHTLVDTLTSRYHGRVAVTGIFEASMLSAMSLLPHASAPNEPQSQWGVVTTGKFWEKHLGDGVKSFLGETETTENLKFRGIISTGLTAGDFHHVSPSEVKAKLVQATKTLLGEEGVSVVAMGCGGMAGLEEIIRSTAVEQYGAEKGSGIYVVDGVKAGILQLENTIKCRRAFRNA